MLSMNPRKTKTKRTDSLITKADKHPLTTPHISATRNEQIQGLSDGMKILKTERDRCVRVLNAYVFGTMTHELEIVTSVCQYVVLQLHFVKLKAPPFFQDHV